MKDKVKLGIFDIDGTIFRSSLLIEIVRGLVAAGIFPKQANKEMEADYLAWLNRVGDYDGYIRKVLDIYNKYIVGRDFDEVEEVSDLVMAREKNKVYRFTRDLIHRLKRENYYLVAISGSPWYMVRKFALHNEFDVSFGTEMCLKKGKFTNCYIEKDFKNGEDKLLGFEHKAKLMNFSNKGPLLTQYLDSQKMKADWKNSVAVGDSGNDIAMLELVGHPIAFNPDDILAKKAKKSRWQIVVERKNVIYDVKKFDFVPYQNQISSEK